MVRPVLELTFDLERARFGKPAAALEAGPPVFVCGLARAGTSITVRLLDAVGEFASPSYRDMPWPLAPNMWARAALRAGRRQVGGERGHGDGLEHDLDTPEAIEEVFWRCFEGDRYIRRDGLDPVRPEPETLDKFRSYVQLLMLSRGRRRYLSKNNNNVLRLASLQRCFPAASLIHPFRHPLRQAASLLHQHRKACELHRADPFRRDFMRWLGHHEFGADQRPFLLPRRPDAELSPSSIEYWLAAWVSVYSHLLDQTGAVADRQTFLDYDRMLAEPERSLGRLEQATGLPWGSLDRGRLRAPASAAPVEHRSVWLEEALDLHSRLQARAVDD